MINRVHVSPVLFQVLMANNENRIPRAWEDVPVLGLYVHEWPVMDEDRQRAKWELGVVLEVVERYHTGCVKSHVGGPSCMHPVEFKKNIMGAWDDATDLKFTCNVVGKTLVFMTDLGSKKAKDLLVGGGHEVLYNVFWDNVVGGESDGIIVNHTGADGYQNRVRVFCRVNDCGKYLVFGTTRGYVLARFLEVLLGIDIEKTVDDMICHPWKYYGGDPFSDTGDSDSD